MELERKKSGRPSKRPEISLLGKLYRTMTAREIAEKYGVKESTVRSWVSRARKSENK